MSNGNLVRCSDEALANLKGMRAERIRLELSVVDLAEKINVKSATIRRYETGCIMPSTPTYNKLAKVLGWHELNDPFDDISSKVKASRINKNLSLRELSTTVNITVALIVKYEKGEIIPSVHNYNKLAKFFGWQELEIKMITTKRQRNKSRYCCGWIVEDATLAKEKKTPVLKVNSVYLVGNHEMMYAGKVGAFYKFVAVKGAWSTTLSKWQLCDNVRRKEKKI